MKPEGKKERECQKCIMHGIHVKLKGHKSSCYYRDCQCQRCQVVTIKRQKNKIVIAQKRRLELLKGEDHSMDLGGIRRERNESSDSEVDNTTSDTETREPMKRETPNKRSVYCRRCQVHGVKNLLRGHKEMCAFKGCWCPECRLVSQSNSGAPTLCSHCGYYTPGLHSSLTRVHPYPRPLYGMPPIVMPHHNATSSGTTDSRSDHFGYQSQLPQGPPTYDNTGTFGFTSLQPCPLPDSSFQPPSRNFMQDAQPSQLFRNRFPIPGINNSDTVFQRDETLECSNGSQ